MHHFSDRWLRFTGRAGLRIGGGYRLAHGAWRMANILYKKADSRQVFAFLIWSSLFAPILLFILAYAVNGLSGFQVLIAHTRWTTLLSILFQVYPNTLFGYWVWNALLKRYPVSTVAPLSLLVAVCGLLRSFWIFDEQL